MALLVPNSAEIEILKYIFNQTSPENLVIRLYSNNVTPSETDTVGTYTETTGGGYAPINLTPGNWTLLSGNPATASHTLVEWTFNASVGNVYGYYVTRISSGDLVWAERFTNGPYNINNVGDILRITPRLSLE